MPHPPHTPLAALFAGSTALRWFVVNDTVMGGVSSSRAELTPRNTLVFAGRLSLENNGGFASIRTAPHPFALGGYEGLEITVVGDGRTYQCRLRTEDHFDGTAYRMAFSTTEGSRLTVRLPFRKFEATYRGRTLPDAPDPDPARIRRIGFMIADRREGPFTLEVLDLRPC